MTKPTPRKTPSKKTDFDFTFEYGNCVDLFSSLIGLKTAQAKYVMTGS